MGRTICSRVSLFKWGISPFNSRRWYTHDADQWQILEEVLSLIGSSYDQVVNITPLIITFRSKTFGRAQKKSFFLSLTDHIHCRLVSSQSNTGYIEEETKLWTSVLALSLFSSPRAILSTDHITVDRRQAHGTMMMHDWGDDKDGLGFGIQVV